MLWKIREQRAQGKLWFRLQPVSEKHILRRLIQKNYERVLFVAHREEILKQAAESFKKCT